MFQQTQDSSYKIIRKKSTMSLSLQCLFTSPVSIKGLKQVKIHPFRPNENVWWGENVPWTLSTLNSPARLISTIILFCFLNTCVCCLMENKYFISKTEIKVFSLITHHRNIVNSCKGIALSDGDAQELCSSGLQESTAVLPTVTWSRPWLQNVLWT